MQGLQGRSHDPRSAPPEGFYRAAQDEIEKEVRADE